MNNDIMTLVRELHSNNLTTIGREKIKQKLLNKDKQIEELQDRIDKAIEELKTLSNLYDDNYTISDKAKDIIEILKGE